MIVLTQYFFFFSKKLKLIALLVLFSLRLDCTEIISVSVFGVFLWVLCTIYGTCKYGFQQT